MISQVAQAITETIGPVTQFGVAGLMGGLWWWERKCSREREEQLGEAHQKIIQQGAHLAAVLEALANNTRVLAEFTAAHQELCRVLRDR